MYPCPISVTVDKQCFYIFHRLIRKLVKEKQSPVTERSYIIRFFKVMLLKKILLQDKFFILIIIYFYVALAKVFRLLKLKDYSLRIFSSKKTLNECWC